MTRYFSFLLISILATGCILTPTKEVYVDVPYPADCVTWQPERQSSQFDLLGNEAPLWEQVKSLVLDRENDKLFIEGQNAVIQGCR